jgi:tetratricopeptide (TPR) repeat protein
MNPKQLDKDALRDIIGGPEPSGPTIQEYRPFPQSLDWKLAKLYWNSLGPRAFANGDVPYKVNNDGRASEDYCNLVLESLRSTSHSARADRTIYFVELGIGSGLFSKLFLDTLKHYSVAGGEDFYGRTKYLLLDASPRILNDVKSSGILDEHESRLIYLECDVSDSDQLLRRVREAALGDFAGVDGIFANYILDNLPATVLFLRGNSTFELQVRTSLDANSKLGDRNKRAIEQLERCLASAEPIADARLIDAYKSFVLDTQYVRITREELPHERLLPLAGADEQGLCLHSYGALQCLDACCQLLRPGGLMIIADYGHTANDLRSEVFEYQHFGGSIAIGVNFAELQALVSNHVDHQWFAPEEEIEQIIYRAVGHRLSAEVADSVRQTFSKKRLEALVRPVVEGMALAEKNQLEAARWSFYKAFNEQPRNWVVVNAVASFFAYQLKDYDRAARIADYGLAMNPISVELWNVRGDCHYYRDRYDEAESAFRKAIALNPWDIRGRYNLAFVLADTSRTAEALAVLGEALGLDRDGDFREKLLQKQSDLLTQMERTYNEERLRLANRFRGHRWLPGS